MKISVLLVSIFALARCENPPDETIAISAPFDESEAARVFEDGNNTIFGSAIVHYEAGDTQTTGCVAAYLRRQTAHADERILAIYGDAERGNNAIVFGQRIDFEGRRIAFEPDPPAYRENQRRLPCDPQGRFEFQNVADGGYYVIAEVHWFDSDTNLWEGRALMRRVNVEGGETISVDFSE